MQEAEITQGISSRKSFKKGTEGLTNLWKCWRGSMPSLGFWFFLAAMQRSKAFEVLSSLLLLQER